MKLISHTWLVQLAQVKVANKHTHNLFLYFYKARQYHGVIKAAFLLHVYCWYFCHFVLSNYSHGENRDKSDRNFFYEHITFCLPGWQQIHWWRVDDVNVMCSTGNWELVFCQTIKYDIEHAGQNEEMMMCRRHHHRIMHQPTYLFIYFRCAYYIVESFESWYKIR